MYWYVTENKPINNVRSSFPNYTLKVLVIN